MNLKIDEKKSIIKYHQLYNNCINIYIYIINN